MEKIEYRVRPVTRFIVTRYESDDRSAGPSVQRGEFEQFDIAYEVGYALCKAEHERLGWPLDDERIQYPMIGNATYQRPSKRLPTGDAEADSLEDKAALYLAMSDDLRAQAAQKRHRDKHGNLNKAATV